MEERWCAIREAPNYEVSNKGNVRNRLNLKPKSKTMVPQRGYCVSLNSKTYAISRLVAEAFIPNPRNFRIVKFHDGNKLNCVEENLYWDRSSKTYAAVIATDIITGEEIYFDSVHDAVEKHNLNASHISRSCWNENYSHGGYKWRYVYDN